MRGLRLPDTPPILQGFLQLHQISVRLFGLFLPHINRQRGIHSTLKLFEGEGKKRGEEGRGSEPRTVCREVMMEIYLLRVQLQE